MKQMQANIRYDVVWCLVGFLSSNRRYKRLKKIEEGMTFIANGSIAFSQENEVKWQCHYRFHPPPYFGHTLRPLWMLSFLVCCYYVVG